MFVDLDWPLNASSLLSASAELLVWVVLLTDRQTNTQKQKHNRLGGGNEWVLKKKKLLKTVKREQYFGWHTQKQSHAWRTIRKNNIGEKRGRLKTSWLDDLKARTGLRLEKALQAAADKCKMQQLKKSGSWRNQPSDRRWLQNHNRRDYILICMHIEHSDQVCTNRVIHHLVQILVYLVRLYHCTTPGYAYDHFRNPGSLFRGFNVHSKSPEAVSPACNSLSAVSHLLMKECWVVSYSLSGNLV